MKKYDLVIIGSGPGGYTAALYAAQKKLKTCLIEKEQIGGVCLNSGCIPTKTYFKSAQMLSSLKKAGTFGIDIKDMTFDMKKVTARTNEIVDKLSNGVKSLLDKRGVDIIFGEASFENENKIKVKDQSIVFDNAIIATGSEDIELASLRFCSTVLSSKSVWSLKEVPKKMVIVGGGVIGCEMANIFTEFGSNVTLVEAQKTLLPLMDMELSKRLALSLKKKGVNVILSKQVTSSNYNNIFLEDQTEIPFDKALVCIGRKPVIKNMKLERADIKIEDDAIRVNDSLQTSRDHIYAIGDCNAKTMLAHAASFQGLLAVDNILGEKRHTRDLVMPNCVFTDPEIAECGISSKNVTEEMMVSKFMYGALGKGHAAGSTEGFIKLISEKGSKKIIGITIMGEHATELIAEASVIITNKMTTRQLVDTIHAHPTFSEIFVEAAHIAEGIPINSF